MIKENIENILKDLPPGVKIVAAAKERSVDEIREAISSGIKIIGENYINEARSKFEVIGKEVKWHFIGHLQKNKAKYAAKIFNVVETLDSLELAEVLDRECCKINKIMPVFLEINSASEPQKQGILIEEAEGFLDKILRFKHLKPSGLMTMGPFSDNPEELRPFFKKTKNLFDKIKLNYGNILEWKYLSMGMSFSYQIAIEEGANIVRIGAAVFGPRKQKI